MNLKQRVILALIPLSMPIMSFSQLNLPVKQLGGSSYYYYEVQKNETVYGIAQKLGVNAEDIVRYNPTARDGVNKKQMLFLPVEEFAPAAKAKANKPNNEINMKRTTPTERVTHVVQKGETVYGLSKIYNVNESDLIAINPGIKNGLKAGQTIVVPPAGNNAAGNNTLLHTMAAGETLYSLAKDYSTTVEAILKDNPGVSPNRLHIGDVVKITPNTASKYVVKQDFKQFTPYVIKKGDTFSSIARKHNLDVNELKAANPDVKEAKKGKTIYLPRTASRTRELPASQTTAEMIEKSYKPDVENLYNAVHNYNEDKNIDIALILPFQLHKNEADRPRQAATYMEFFQGFAMGANDAYSGTGRKINVGVYDTQHNLDETDRILAVDTLKNYDVIIAPSEPKQLERMNKFGNDNKIFVLNPFSTANEDYANNPMVMQLNIPTSYMTNLVTQWFDEKFADYTVVYLEDPNVAKKDFYSSLQAHLSDKKHPTKTLTIINPLTFKSLSRYLDPGTNYIFVPSNGSKDLLNKVLPAIKETKERRVDCELSLLGFPEYTMYLPEQTEALKSVDTYVFSRFFNPRNDKVAMLEKRYEEQSGTKAMNMAPTMWLLGYDVGTFLLKALLNNNDLGSSNANHEGVQTNFRFERASNWGGLINKSVQIIHFAPNADVEIIVK